MNVARRSTRGLLLSLALHALGALAVARLVWWSGAPINVAPPRPAWVITFAPEPKVEPASVESASVEPASVESATVEPATVEPATVEPASVEETPRRPSRLGERSGHGAAPNAAPAAHTAERLPAESAKTPVPAPTSAGPRASLDLSAVRKLAIDTVLEERQRELSYRSFSFPGTLGEERAFREAASFRRAESGRKAPLTAFDSSSKGRAGMEERTVGGEYVRWVSDDCYETSGTANLFILPPLKALASMPRIDCVRGQARDDLFADARPDYLMNAEERATADAEFQRRDRLRRPTTGVVMALP